MRHVTTSDTNLRRFFGNGFALPLSLKNPTHFLESLLQSTLSAFSRVKFQHQNAYKMKKRKKENERNVHNRKLHLSIKLLTPWLEQLWMHASQLPFLSSNVKVPSKYGSMFLPCFFLIFFSIYLSFCFFFFFSFLLFFYVSKLYMIASFVVLTI
jgi:hypothetical protein